MKLVFYFLLLTPLMASAYSDAFFSENEDPTIFHHVNVISGNLNLSFQDSVVQGALPISIPRSYCSSGALERSVQDFDLFIRKERKGWLLQGGWTFFPHIHLFLVRSNGTKAFLSEPNGNMISYSYSHSQEGEKHIIFLKPAKDSGQFFGKISSRTNLQNTLLKVDLKEGVVTVILPDGGLRRYCGPKLYKARNSLGSHLYLLSTERLPSDHRLRYRYDTKSTNLQRIELINPLEKKVYASIDINYSSLKRDKLFELTCNSSDGKQLHYKTLRHERREYIHEMVSNCRPHERCNFVPGRKGIGARLASIDIGGKKAFGVHYYLPFDKARERKWAEKPEQKEFHIDKVEKITAPVGGNSEEVTVASFFYYPNRTDVRDAEGLLIRYTHDSKKLTLVEFFDEKDQLHSYQKFYWEENHLCCKAMFDKNHQPLFAKTFRYEGDDVVEELLWGALTGNNTAPLQINERGVCSGSESYRKSYTYYRDQHNLLHTESEEDGLTYEYFYKGNTDLCIAKLTKDKKGNIFLREFLFYDDDNLVIREIIDDGSSYDSNDRQGVTQRLEKQYERNSSSGLPEWLIESYWDPATQSQKLLKKIKYSYLNQRVHTEEIFDANGDSRYTLVTDYDRFGSIARKTTPIGRENSYRYNAQNYLEESKEVGSCKRVFSYDMANRLTSCKEQESGKVVNSCYDCKGRVLSQTDFRNNKTFHTYDCFGNRKTTSLPQCEGEKGQIYTPTLEFEYDIQGNIVVSRAPLGETTQTSYNLFRKPTVITGADGMQIYHFYNKNGTLEKSIYPDGVQVHYHYDLLKRLTSKSTYSQEGIEIFLEKWEYGSFQLLSYTDIRGLKTEYTYDGAGRKIAEEAEGRRVTFSYDSLGFLEKTGNGVITTVQKCNVEGLPQKQWEEDNLDHIENEMEFFYDRENRKEKAHRKTSQGIAIDLFSYRDGKLSKHIDPHGRVTEFFCDEFHQNALGQQVLQKRTINPLGHQTIETFDVGERLVMQEKKDSRGETLFKEEFFYDPSGNKTKHTSYIYADHIFQKEISLIRKYDCMGRIKEEVESDKKSTFFNYDLRGRLAKKSLPDGICLYYSYDGVDRLSELKSSDDAIHYRYFYELGPDPTQISDLRHDITILRRYNLFGELIFEVNGRGLSSEWDYDSIGRCISFTLPDGSSIQYPTQGSHISAVQRRNDKGDLLYEHRYDAFDCNGHVEKEDLIGNLGSLQTTCDLLERPTMQSCSYMNQSISYDYLGRVSKSYNSLFGEKLYKYDALNQLKKEGDKDYSFDSLGNPTQFTVNELNQISSTPNYMVTYDANGNPKERISPDKSVEYQFDPLGRLTEITTVNEKKIVYSYDPLSRLFSKKSYIYTSNNWREENSLFYLYDQDQEIGTQDEKGQILELKVLGLGIMGDIGATIALEIENTIYAPLHDFHGNIIAILSPDSSMVEKYEIDAFGVEKNSTCISPWRFSSKRSEEGLFFFGIRFYDPTMKRWLTPDPAGFVDGLNLYLFVQNSPTNRLDLFGLSATDPYGRVEMMIPIPTIPRDSGFEAFYSKGSIDGVPVDFVVCCGLWHQLKFTPKEMKAGEVNMLDHLHELTPKEGKQFGLITVGNGINTSLKECYSMSSEVGKYIGDTLLVALYNPSEGAVNDIHRTNQERKGVETPIVCLARQFMATIGEKLYNINPQSLWLCIPHSENGVITKRAIEGMNVEQQEILQKNLHIFALAPAEPLPLTQGASVINVYSNKDYVTGFGPFGYVRRFEKDDRYDIRIVPCISPYKNRIFGLADHGFLGPTYQKAWENHINSLSQDFSFYRRSAYESR